MPLQPRGKAKPKTLYRQQTACESKPTAAAKLSFNKSAAKDKVTIEKTLLPLLACAWRQRKTEVKCCSTKTIIAWNARIAMYRQTTRSITISVKPTYLDDQSSPDEQRFVWKYQVRIENNGNETVQLRHRHWRITDSRGKIQEVRGAGVVGEQPILAPGDIFEYTSGTPLATPSGIMVGTYEMENQSGEVFNVDVPAFSLDSPHQPQQIN